MTSPAKPRPIIGGNWKMNTDHTSSLALAQAVAKTSSTVADKTDVAIFPPFPYLLQISQALCAAGSKVMLGAQDLYIAEKGAFTGEISAAMLKDCGVRTVLVGHSERRHIIHEGDDLIAAKLDTALAAGLQVVLCVGETLHQREAGETDHITELQIERGLKHVKTEQLSHVVIAYEPVWAIGTGKTASPDDAQNAHNAIRAVVASMFDKPSAANLRIQYGGSVTAANAASIMSQPDVNGALVGGASLKPEEFAAIVNAAAAN